MVLVGMAMMAPIVHVVAISLSSNEYVIMNQVRFLPKGLNLSAYSYVFRQGRLWRSLFVTIYITAMGTVFALALTSSMAYALSRAKTPGRRLINQGVLVTFIFSMPIIPFYLVVRSLGLMDSLWALILPTALTPFNVIIMRTFFSGISQELFDAATIDGCSEIGIYFRITLPLSLAVIATIGLFHAVHQWNTYFHALMFIRSYRKDPLQVLLRSLVIEDELASISQQGDDPALLNTTPEQLKAAVILFATMPILIVYPFIQRYFVKGATLGSLKG